MLFVALTSVSWAQKYACVNTDYILKSIPDYTNAQKRLDKYVADWQKELQDKQDEVDAMRADYEQVLRYEPDHKNALTGLILNNIEEKRLPDAYDQANHLVELYKDDAASYATRAQVEEAMEKYSLAIDDISSAIDITAKSLTPNQRLSYGDEYTQYVLQRIALYRKQMEQ